MSTDSHFLVGTKHANAELVAFDLDAELATRELATRNVLPFVELFHPKYLAGWFHTNLCALLDDFIRAVEDGRSPRLIITTAPRVGKSTIVSERLPPYMLGRHPDWEVIGATYGQDLSDTFGRKVRDLMNNPIYQDLFQVTVDPRSNSADFLRTHQGGSYKAVGVGGSLNGIGANVLIIDDPIKDRQEAESALLRSRLKDWYTSVARTRLHPGAGLIITATRWHVDDLIGTLLKEQETNKETDQFIVYEFPAIARQDEPYRKAGEALHPERYPLSALKRIKAVLPPRDWEALYQCQPFIESGNFFKADWIKYYDTLPANINWITSVDFAVSTKAGANCTCIVAAGLGPDGETIYIHPDIIYGRYAPGDSVKQCVQYMKQLESRVLMQETGVIKHALSALFDMEMRKQKWYPSLKTGEYTRSSTKHVVAAGIAGLMEAGRIRFPRTAWMERDGVSQLLRFSPTADNSSDDFVDALAGIGLAAERKMMSPALPELPVAEDATDEDEEGWKRIMHSERTPKRPTRLNGDSL